jgi:hypothetical protein
MQEEPVMPLCFLEAPEGIESNAKATMMQKAHVALAEAYPFPDDDTRIYLTLTITSRFAADHFLRETPRGAEVADVAVSSTYRF